MQVQIEKPRIKKQLKVGIVGPEESKWSKEQKFKAKQEIHQILLGYALTFGDYEVTMVSFDKVILVSGHCPRGGVDIWAEAIADKLGIQKEIYKADVNQWDDEIIEGKLRLVGYKTRNILIAKASDVVYCIVPFTSKASCVHHGRDLEGRKEHLGHSQNGGCWVLRFCQQIGKESHLVVIE